MALIFDRVVVAESLPAGKFGGQLTRTTSVTGDVNRSINLSKYVLPLVIRDFIDGVVSSRPINSQNLNLWLPSLYHAV